MKVAILLSNRWNSAITEYALSVASSLRLTGYSVVFIPLANSPGEKRARELEFSTHSLAGFGIGAFHKCLLILDKEHPDIILTCGGPEESLVALLPTNGIRLRFRGQSMGAPSFLGRILVTAQSSRTAKIIFPSAQLEVRGRSFFQSEKCCRIILGINTKRFHIIEQEEVRDELLIFGRFDPVKGHEHFMNIYGYAKGMLNKQGRPMPQLHIVGEEANVSESQLIAAAGRIGLIPGKDVRVSKGRHPNPAKLLSGALIGIVSSIGSELICRVAEEFLVCGTPIFVSGMGSLDEMIFDRSGWSYRGMGIEGAARMLAGAIEMSRSESRLARSERAAMAQRMFSYEAMGRQLDGLIKSAVIEKSKPR